MLNEFLKFETSFNHVRIARPFICFLLGISSLSPSMRHPAKVVARGGRILENCSSLDVWGLVLEIR